VVCVDGVVLSETEDGVPTARQQVEDLLAPLRSVADPIIDTWQLSTPTAVLETHMDPVDPLPIVGDHLLLDDLDDEGAAELLRVVGPGSGSPLISAELRQLGGAIATPSPAGGALDHVDAAYAYLGAGVPDGPAEAQAIEDHCAVVRAALGPWDSGRTIPTFAKHLDQPQGHLSPAQVQEVDRIRARVDPTGRFRDDISPNASAR